MNYNSYRPITGTGHANPAGPFGREGNLFVCEFKEVTDGLSTTIFLEKFGQTVAGTNETAGHIRITAMACLIRCIL